MGRGEQKWTRSRAVSRVIECVRTYSGNVHPGFLIERLMMTDHIAPRIWGPRGIENECNRNLYILLPARGGFE